VDGLKKKIEDAKSKDTGRERERERGGERERERKRGRERSKEINKNRRDISIQEMGIFFQSSKSCLKDIPSTKTKRMIKLDTE